MLGSIALAAPAVAHAKRPMPPPMKAEEGFKLKPVALLLMRRGSSRLEAPARTGQAIELARVETPAARLDGLLALRSDLRVIVNGGIENARKERIALGLHFARAF